MRYLGHPKLSYRFYKREVYSNENNKLSDKDLMNIASYALDLRSKWRDTAHNICKIGFHLQDFPGIAFFMVPYILLALKFVGIMGRFVYRPYYLSLSPFPEKPFGILLWKFQRPSVLLCRESCSRKTTVSWLINGLVPQYYEDNLPGSKTTLIVTHDSEPIYRCCTYMFHLEQGISSEFYSRNSEGAVKLKKLFLSEREKEAFQ